MTDRAAPELTEAEVEHLNRQLARMEAELEAIRDMLKARIADGA